MPANLCYFCTTQLHLRTIPFYLRLFSLFIFYSENSVNVVLNFVQFNNRVGFTWPLKKACFPNYSNCDLSTSPSVYVCMHMEV